MDLERALQIPALMSEGEMSCLAKLASTRSRIVEIGSWQGASARAMADNTAGIVYCVDTWRDDAYGSAPAEVTGSPEWLWNAFIKHHIDHIGSGKVTPIRCSSQEGAIRCSDLLFDMIFIDAGHSYEDVKADILAWRPLLEKGGTLCGHDLYPPNTHHPGVRQAVEELIPDHRTDGTIWIAI